MPHASQQRYVGGLKSVQMPHVHPFGFRACWVGRAYGSPLEVELAFGAGADMVEGRDGTDGRDAAGGRGAVGMFGGGPLACGCDVEAATDAAAGLEGIVIGAELVPERLGDAVARVTAP